jgi:hypothetical protein
MMATMPDAALNRPDLAGKSPAPADAPPRQASVFPLVYRV